MRFEFGLTLSGSRESRLGHFIRAQRTIPLMLPDPLFRYPLLLLSLLLRCHSTDPGQKSTGSKNMTNTLRCAGHIFSLFLIRLC